MKYPQEYATTFFKSSCLAFCYLFCSGKRNLTNIEAVKQVLWALQEGILDEDGTVKDGEELLRFFSGGKSYRIEKMDINSISDIHRATPVLYEASGYIPHWVVVEKGEIVFDPILNSNSVKKGRPVSARVITERR